MNFDLLKRLNDETAKKRLTKRKATSITENMKKIWKFIKQKLIKIQNDQKRYADKHRTSSLDYKSENMIWLFTKNIRIARSSRKLDHKMIESFKIRKMLSKICQLKLSFSMKIYNIFHTSLLRLVVDDSLSEQIALFSSSIILNDQNEEEWELNDILNSRLHKERLQYKVVWIEHSSNFTWYSASNFTNVQKIINEYYRKYSSKFELDLINQIAYLEKVFVKEKKQTQYWERLAKALIKKILNEMNQEIRHEKVQTDNEWINQWTKRHSFRSD